MTRRWIVVLVAAVSAALPARAASPDLAARQITRVHPTAAARIAAAGVHLDVDAGAVGALTEIEVAALDEPELAPLDRGMTNVTGGGRRGWDTGWGSEPMSHCGIKSSAAG